MSILTSISPLTDVLCHPIQSQAHLSCEGDALVLMFPWCENKEATFSTGVEVLMSWL